MNKCSDYQNDISDTEPYEGLIGFEIFSAKIPIFLTIEDFFCRNFEI